MPKRIHKIQGISLGTASSNTRYGKKEDSLLVTLPQESILSGKFTSNKLKAAPVKLAIEHLSNSKKAKKILLINAGNANAATGPKGLKDVRKYCREIALDFKTSQENVIPFSTGVIGEPLATENYLSAFREASKSLSENKWKKAAEAILTTDTKPKIVSKEVKVGKTSYFVTGFAKGSGMIRPDFATLLSFVFIDAKLSQKSLNNIHSNALKVSFEAITVDGDTSPNDSSLLVANGNKEKSIKVGSVEEKRLSDEITEIFKDLSELKKIKIKISKAKNTEQARSVAFTIAESPLVKTAMFGSDANWGRILSAIGRNKDIDRIDKVKIQLNGQPLVKQGYKDAKYSEKHASKEMKKKEILIEVSLGLGKKGFEVMTSDLSEDYVLINSDYRS